MANTWRHTRELRHTDQAPLIQALQKHTLQFHVDFLLGCLKKIWADKKSNIFAIHEGVVEETQALKGKGDRMTFFFFF